MGVHTYTHIDKGACARAPTYALALVARSLRLPHELLTILCVVYVCLGVQVRQESAPRDHRAVFVPQIRCVRSSIELQDLFGPCNGQVQVCEAMCRSAHTVTAVSSTLRSLPDCAAVPCIVTRSSTHPVLLWPPIMSACILRIGSCAALLRDCLATARASCALHSTSCTCVCRALTLVCVVLSSHACMCRALTLVCVVPSRLYVSCVSCCPLMHVCVVLSSHVCMCCAGVWPSSTLYIVTRL